MQSTKRKENLYKVCASRTGIQIHLYDALLRGKSITRQQLLQDVLYRTLTTERYIKALAADSQKRSTTKDEPDKLPGSNPKRLTNPASYLLKKYLNHL
jgi:hypothetical protein